MAASLHVNSTNDGRISHNYRMPSHPKRSNPGDPSLHFRSPSPQNISRPAKRRHSTPHLSTVRFHDHKTPPINRRLRNYHPEIRSIAASRDRLAKTHRRSRSLVKRPQSDESLTPLGSPMTTMNSISPIAKRNLRSIAETSTSEIPPRQNQPRHEDGYLSDQETWSETVRGKIKRKICISNHVDLEL